MNRSTDDGGDNADVVVDSAYLVWFEQLNCWLKAFDRYAVYLSLFLINTGLREHGSYTKNFIEITGNELSTIKTIDWINRPFYYIHKFKISQFVNNESHENELH